MGGRKKGKGRGKGEREWRGEGEQKCSKIYPKTHQIAPFYKQFSRGHAQKPF